MCTAQLAHASIGQRLAAHRATPMPRECVLYHPQVVVLYVDEATSIQRQLQRAVAARAHNARVKDAGVSEQARLQEERPTDLDLNKATKRYQIFKQHYSAILRLKQFLPFQ